MPYIKNTTTTKFCPRCKQVKPRTEFYASNSKSDGCASYCKLCSQIRNKEFRQKYLERVREGQRGFSYRYFRTPSGRYTTIKSRCKRKGTSLSMSRQEFIRWFNEQTLRCYYCDWPVEALESKAQRDIDSLVIDRKDNELGYSLDNICISCWLCNQIKSNFFTEEEMLYIGTHFIRTKRENPNWQIKKIGVWTPLKIRPCERQVE